MEYNSFYGGRRGASFVIVKKYKTIRKPDVTNWFWKKVMCQDLGIEFNEDVTFNSNQIKEWMLDNCMEEAFKLGGGYTTVNYDEYVIIDAPNKNDKDNGKIFRRGYGYVNDLGGAIYIGQIVGPAGMAPQVEMTTIGKITDSLVNDGLIATEDTETVTRGEHEFILKDGEEEKAYYRTTGGSYEPNENLLPGKYWDADGNEQFNDEIQWLACSIRDQNSHETTVHVGFKIPYLVTEYIANSVSPYYHRTDAEHQDMDNWDEVGDTTTFSNDKLITREDDISHPYFQRWNIKIPKGKKGDSLNNFRITTVEAEESKDIRLQTYPGIDEDAITGEDKKRQILVYDYYNYDRDAGGDPVALYLGDYNIIDNFQISDNGTVTIDYSHDDRDIYPNLFKWIKEVSFNDETGYLKITFNTLDEEGNNTTFETNLRYIKDVDIHDDGTIKFIYTYGNSEKGETLEKIYDNYLKKIDSVSLDPETGHFIVNYNYEYEEDGTPTVYDTYLRYVKDIKILDDGTIQLIYTHGDNVSFDKYFKSIKTVTLDNNGNFDVTYNQDNDKNGNPTKYHADLKWVNGIRIENDGTVFLTFTKGNDEALTNRIKWITGTEFSNNGTLKFNYNDGTSNIYENQIKYINLVSLANNGEFRVQFNNGDPDYVTSLKWPADISLNVGTNEGEGSQKFKIVYNNGDTKEIGNPLNYIMETAMNRDTGYHLLVLYSDPARRIAIKEAHKNATYNGRDDWYDLGYIGQGSVGSIASAENDVAAEEIINELPPYSTWFIVEGEDA